MIEKNWQELIKPSKLDVKPGHDPACSAQLIAEPAATNFVSPVPVGTQTKLVAAQQATAAT